VAWRYARWTAEHALPLGLVERREIGARVNAGDVIAEGTQLGPAVRVPGARRLGIAGSDIASVMRVVIGSEVTRGTVLARTVRRFARVVKAPIDGRLVHVTADGDLYVAPIAGRWVVRSTLDGAITRSDEACVLVEGAAWCLGGLAAYGPDAVGELALGVDAAGDELRPAGIDARLGGRMLVGGARIAAEAIPRPHACRGSAPAAGAPPGAGPPGPL